MNNNNFEIYSAGILPYTNYKGTIYFLLGRDYDHKWSDFGGHVEPKDRSEHETTACREFYEETLGSVLDYDYTKKLLKHKKYNLITAKTNNGNNYYMYLIRINYNDNIKEKFISTKNFISNINYNNSSKPIDKKYLEKTDIRWVSFETIENSLNDKSWISLRTVFQNNFKNNIDIIKKNI